MSTESTKKKHEYVRLSVVGRNGKTTISLTPPQFGELALLARGSADFSEVEHTRRILRESVRELIAEGYEGKLSRVARERAYEKLKAAYSEARARSYDARTFPEGTPVAA